MVPPAPSIFSRADFETPWVEMVSFFVRSPWPRIFTSIRVVRIRRFAFSDSGVTSAPASNTRSRSRTLTPCVCVRNGPMGIASFDVLPGSFGKPHEEPRLTALEAGRHLVRARP